jgi:hypothetical protein
VLSTFHLCPFAEIEVTGDGIVGPDCTRFYVGTMDALLRMRPALVILAARTDRYVELSTIGARRVGSRFTHSPDAKARLWREGLGATLRNLSAAGIPTLVVDPVPPFEGAPQGCATIRIVTYTCAESVSRPAVERDLLRSIRATAAAAATTSRSATIDFYDELCTRTTCSTVRRETYVYADGNHLSIAGSLLLTPTFYRAICAQARPSGPTASLASRPKASLMSNRCSGTRQRN